VASRYPLDSLHSGYYNYVQYFTISVLIGPFVKQNYRNEETLPRYIATLKATSDLSKSVQSTT